MEAKLQDAIRRIQVLRDEILAPFTEGGARLDDLSEEDYGRFMAYGNVLDILQILAHDGTPAQGESRKA